MSDLSIKRYVLTAHLTYSLIKICSGYDSVVFAHRDFYALLPRQVPSENISFSKKVLKTTEEDGKVTIHMSDNTAYECDLLVGAGHL